MMQFFMRSYCAAILVAVMGGMSGQAAETAALDNRHPDLVPETIRVKAEKFGTQTTIRQAKLEVENIGDLSSRKTRVDFYLSDDDRLTTGDVLVSQMTLRRLRPGQESVRVVNRISFRELNGAGKRIVVVLDPENKVEEQNEINNTLVSDVLPF